MNSTLQHRSLNVNGIQMHVVEQGPVDNKSEVKYPLAICCHGWPELGFSWRHQIPALVNAGFRVVVPDMRGFGKTEAPPEISQYTILHMVGDIVGLVAALGEQQAVVIGHDWGAPVAWSCALMRPDVFPRVIAMSVPHRPRGPAAPIAILRKQGLHNYYWCYFQTPGVAEAEFERDVPVTLRKIIYGVSGDAPIDRESPLMVPEGHGFIDHLRVPEKLPVWISEEDLAVFVAEYKRTGFRGGLNWYRNIDRNWELTAPWQDARVEQPALFIAGTRDPVIAGKRGAAAIEAMHKAVPNVQKVLIERAGHWIQQEKPAEVNAAMLSFLSATA
jgi:pimeloyl-ACP methyl ester carboxylesterase